MSDKKKGLIIAGPDGEVYQISREDLARFKVKADDVEKTIADAEAEGFLDMEEEVAEPEEVPMEVAAPPAQTAPVINIFLGGEPVAAAPQPVAPQPEAEPAPGGSTMAKYAGGSTMAKYAGGSTMAKYAGGSTMAKYAGGSTMAKYAGGSTMAKYAGGSTMAKYAGGSTMAKYAGGSTMAAPREAEVVIPAITFYGDWGESDD